MKNCAIICEYNPFHTGHKYQLDEVRRLGADNVFCVMSGNFVQSAFPAFCDKALRAECAIRAGADAVIEMPTVYATASAQVFAEGGIKIIRGLKDVTHIAMGAVGNPDTVLRLAETKIKYSDRFSSTLKSYLQQGKSYNTSSRYALYEIFSSVYPDRSHDDALDDPNNILCVEYISAIDRFSADIQPLIIPRRGAAHNDGSADGEYVSATAIRSAKKLSDVKRYIPYNYGEIAKCRKHAAPNVELYKNIAVFAVKCADTEFIRSLRDCSEGLEYLIKDMCKLHGYDDYIDGIVGKRYSKKRISRLFLDCALGITRNLTEKRFCTRLLACSKNFNFTLLPDFVNATNADIKTAEKSDAEVAAVLAVDKRATALYNTLCGIDGDYYSYSLVKV